MRTLDDASERWKTIFENHDSSAALKQATARQEPIDDSEAGSTTPCDTGLRSVCWRIFLLYPDGDIGAENWLATLRSERKAFQELREHHLKDLVIDVEDVDPLAEDESNPYELYRRDEELRQEIFQDIERCMPENTFFREPKVQKALLEILFIYCKLNQDVSYRQGFHELAAVVYWVVVCDAISPEAAEGGDPVMREVLDAAFIDHDAFSLFQSVMKSAKSWYELEEDVGNGGRLGSASIVRKSKYIHETLLMATDPELSEYLKTLDVLPQVFLMLLFGREFPFEELLVVWDRIFAVDPELHLVDLICVAMLLRIRWRLIEADYSTALTLLLRYPSPTAPYSPVTLVEDAIYLRDNLSTGGGKYIITKYTKRPPLTFQPKPPLQKPKPRRQALSPSMKPLFQSGQIESLVQDVAKNMLDRSEKWGVNRAVREAVVEVKRNVGYPQNPPVKYELGSTREEELAKRNKALAKVIQDGEERRRQMARILDTALGELGIPEAREDAVRRIAHVKECLLDDSIPLDKDLLQPAAALSPVASPKSKTRRRSVKADPRPPPVSPPGTFVRASFKNNSDPDFISLAQRPRATLAQSSFAWMLGDDLVSKHRSGFVAPSSSASQRKPSVDPLKGEDVITNGERREDEMGFDLGTFRKAEA